MVVIKMNKRAEKFRSQITATNRVFKGCLLAVFLYSSVRHLTFFSKQRYHLGDKADRKIVIIGGGFSGLITAYYLTNDERNKVVLLEKNRKLCEESSLCTGNTILPFDSVPKTSVRMTDIFKSFYLINGPYVC